MSSNQEKLQQASALLKEVDASKGDLNKQIKLLNQVNSLIAQVNVGLSPNNVQSTVSPSVQPATSQSQTMYHDNKITVSLPDKARPASSPAQTEVKAEPNNSAALHTNQHPTQSSEVHMSRKQYREMLNKEK